MSDKQVARKRRGHFIRRRMVSPEDVFDDNLKNRSGAQAET
jgi:hypothetical protein